MMRSELLFNKTMFPIGRIALDLEHLRLFEMLQIFKELPNQPTIHGCINDCFMVSGISRDEAKKCCSDLLYHDGSPVFKLKEGPRVAPLCEWKFNYSNPRYSRWRASCEELFVGMSFASDSAFWLRNKEIRQIKTMEEEEGPGRRPDGSFDDKFQEDVADAVVENEGGLLTSPGGTGKSETIKRMKAKFEAKGFWDKPSKKYPEGRSRVILCGFTHVAAANLGEDSITVMRMLHKYARGKRFVFIFDEASMISLSMWGLIAQLKFTGNIIVIIGDFEGQFLPIHEENTMENMPKSPFLLDLVNYLVVHMRKYRRGEDYAHFQFTTSIYPEKLEIRNESTHSAILAARERYPCNGTLCMGTNLVVTHKCRIQINSEVNEWMGPIWSVMVRASEYAKHRDPNKPQDMKIWEGIILMARVQDGSLNIKQTDNSTVTLKNGKRYQVVAIAIKEDDSTEFEMVCVNDKNDKLGETFMMSEEDLARSMRLTHALTYHSCQARTIIGDIRLCQTNHRLFTLRHLIVGLGRAPQGNTVQVM
jgi:hypothetical protein